MPTTHGTGTLDPDVLAVGDNQADISGMASGESSDALNDRLGRPREGQISPGLPLRQFPAMRIASDTNEPNNQNQRKQQQEVIALASWHKDAPKPDAFVPIVAAEAGVPGFIAAIDGRWYPLEMVGPLCVSGGKVTFVTTESEPREIVLADFGVDVAAANEHRVKVARNLSTQQGWMQATEE